MGGRELSAVTVASRTVTAAPVSNSVSSNVRKYENIKYKIMTGCYRGLSLELSIMVIFANA